MAADPLEQYHRSFLSPYYLDNVIAPPWEQKMARTAKDIEILRLRDPKAFEDTRKKLAQALKVQYLPGMNVADANVPLVGERRTTWRSGFPSDIKVAAVMGPVQAPQGAVKHPTTGMLALPAVGFLLDAYVEGTPIHPVEMYAKLDQKFESYATPWELIWSNLSYPYNRGFTPVVDQNYKVIGHYGEVYTHGSSASPNRPVVVVPKEGEGTDLKELIDAGVPIFIATKDGTLRQGYVPSKAYTSEHTVEVRTTTDGEVLSFKAYDSGFLVQPWYSPTDIFLAGKLMVKLGFKTVISSSLVRRSTVSLASRKVFSGATDATARDGAKAYLKHIPKKRTKSYERRGLTEGDLVSLPRMRGASRTLTNQEMETFLRDTLKSRPYLARLRHAQQLNGKALHDELVKIINEWKDKTGKLHLRVTEKTVQRLGSQGKGGWALDSISGKEVMIIEGEIFKNPRTLLTELTHELAYDAVREAGGVASLRGDSLVSGVNKFAHDWLEHVIKNGNETWGWLQSMGH